MIATDNWATCPGVTVSHPVLLHYSDVIMSVMAFQITSLTNVYSTVLFRRKSKKTWKLRVTGLCEGNSPVTGEFPTQRASSAENVSIWWRHHVHYFSFPLAAVTSDASSNGSTSEQNIEQCRSVSCRGRCVDADVYRTNIGGLCHCDTACMFLGDCCQDYANHCQVLKGSELSDGYLAMANIHRLHKHAQCVQLNYLFRAANRLPVTYQIKPFFVVTACDKSHYLYTRCSDRNQGDMLVIAHGILFLNPHCAACHGIRVGDMQLIGEKITDFLDPLRKYDILRTTGTVENRHFIQRYIIPCMTRRCWRSCSIVHAHDDICRPRVTYHGVMSKGIEKEGYFLPSGQCSKCYMDVPTIIDGCPGNTHCITLTFVKFPSDPSLLFTFTKIYDNVPVLKNFPVCDQSCTIGDGCPRCVLRTCQTGFVLRRTSNGSVCIPESFARCSEEFYYQGTEMWFDTFSPMVVKVYKHPPAHVDETSCAQHLHNIYSDLFTNDDPIRLTCTSQSVSFISFRQALNTIDSMDLFLNEQSELHMVIISNHDVISGVSCNGTLTKNRVQTTRRDEKGRLLLRPSDSEKFAYMDESAIIISRTKGDSQTRLFILYCVMSNMSCQTSIKDSLNNTKLERCPKIQLTGVVRPENGILTLGNGKTLGPDEYIYESNNGTRLLICETDTHVHSPSYLRIVTAVCYSISMLCLLLTFIIYLRFTALRTLPGLMLMNLISALFVAQMLYVLNIQSVFGVHPLLCRAMAAAQHYFWLCAFAWMAIMSLDIYTCLQSTLSTAERLKSRYWLYVFSAWIGPMPIIVASILLTFRPNTGLGYGNIYNCWLLNSSSVLFLFAIPVLATVSSNVVLFILCVYRLNHAMSNSAYLGRREDGKQRLCQCVKISSWMGLSWLFGIIPNILPWKPFWYTFTVLNSLQGVQILLAFGLARRTRESFLRTKTTVADVSEDQGTGTKRTGLSASIDN